MVSIGLIKRFTSLEFGQQYSDHELFDKLKECLEKGTEMSSKVIQQIGARL